MVRELLSYLAIADWAIKDEMVLKLAILAERFAPDMRWCVTGIAPFRCVVWGLLPCRTQRLQPMASARSLLSTLAFPALLLLCPLSL